MQLVHELSQFDSVEEMTVNLQAPLKAHDYALIEDSRKFFFFPDVAFRHIQFGWSV